MVKIFPGFICLNLSKRLSDGTVLHGMPLLFGWRLIVFSDVVEYP